MVEYFALSDLHKVAAVCSNHNDGFDIFDVLDHMSDSVYRYCHSVMKVVHLGCIFVYEQL